MNYPPEGGTTRLMAAVLLVLQFQAFIVLMMSLGYSLQVTLSASAAVTAFTTELVVRILGGQDGPGQGPRLPARTGLPGPRSRRARGLSA